MEEHIIVNDENLDALKDDFTPPRAEDEDTKLSTGTEGTKETVTLTKDELLKKIQSAEDKVRGKLSKQIHDLEAKVKELSPVEKTQTEIELENREKAVSDRERRMAVQEKLLISGLDKTLVDYIRDDADVGALSNILDEIVKSRMKSSGYVPNDHSSDDKITPEEYAKMTYSQKAEFSQKHPEAYKRLRGKK